MSIKLPRRQRGLSLVELIMFMVIMGVAATAVLQMLNIATKTSADPIRRKQALLIAEGYMEEVQTGHFTYCDPSDANAVTATSPAGCASTTAQVGFGYTPSGTTRPYNNVLDYSPTNSNVANAAFLSGSTLTDAAGNNLGGNNSASIAGFTVTVALNPVAAAAPLGPSGANAISSTNAASSLNVLRITITVTDTKLGTVVTLDGYRTRYAPNSLP